MQERVKHWMSSWVAPGSIGIISNCTYLESPKVNVSDSLVCGLQLNYLSVTFISHICTTPLWKTHPSPLSLIPLNLQLSASDNPMAQLVNYSCEAADCTGFLLQCWLYFESQPKMLISKCFKIAFIISLVATIYLNLKALL